MATRKTQTKKEVVKVAKKRTKRVTPAAEQHKRFVEAAKLLEADDSLEAMDKAFKKIFSPKDNSRRKS